MFRILIVEDDKNISSIISEELSQWGYETRGIDNFNDVYDDFKEFEPDLVLMDITLPQYNGFYWTQRIRQESNVPIIFISSHSESMDMIQAIQFGADDYITKPFNILEVKARIKAIIRRNSKKSKAAQKNERIIEVSDLKLELDSRRVFEKDKELNLTAKEFDILELLTQNPDKVYSREKLLNIVWGNKLHEAGDVRTVDVHVRRLREKIEPNPSEPKYIHTKWGVGYYFKE